MFRQVFVLLMLASSPLIGRGDVVLQNTTAGTNNSNGSSGSFSITFTAPANANLSGIALYNSNNNLSSFSTPLEWSLALGSTNIGNKSFTSATLLGGNTISGNGGLQYGYFFDFSGSAIANPLSSGSYTLSAISLNSSQTGWSFSTGSSISVTGGSGFSNTQYTDPFDPRYNFQLSTATVPEPGTLVLGAIGLLAGALAFCVRQCFGLGT
jgi:hypothetical protein